MRSRLGFGAEAALSYSTAVHPAALLIAMGEDDIMSGDVRGQNDIPMAKK